METSKFNLWRASFSFCFIDGFLDEAEEQWISEKLHHLPFTQEQKQLLIQDLKGPPKINEILPLITNPVDRGFLVNNLRVLSRLDKHFSPQEKLKVQQITDAVLGKINLDQLNEIIRLDEMASYHEDEVYKIDNKHSFSEAIIKRLQRVLNPGDHKLPEDE